MAKDYHPIVVYKVAGEHKLKEKLWTNGMLTEQGRAILESLKEDGLKFLPDGDIIEVPVKVKEEA